MLRVLGFFLLCLSASVSSALLGAKECTYGPSYWCSSLSNAKSCGAVRHCIDTVWEKKILPDDNGNICNICKDMVNQARQQMESQQNQDLLKQVFEGSCSLLPITQLQKECVRYVDEFIPELIETLASQMNPQVVCATCGLCNSARINKMMQTYEGSMIDNKPMTAVVTDDNCNDCETMVEDVKKMVLSLSKTELLHKMMQICGRLDSLSDGCKAIIEVNFPAIYDYLENQLNSKEACEMFGFCQRIYGTHVTHLSHKTGNEVCDFCESIVQHYKDSLESNTSRAQFREILEGMCRSTGHFSHECLSIVDQYCDMIYDMLVSEVDAQKVCEAIGLCGPSSVFNSDLPTWTLFNIKPSDHMQLPRIPLEQDPSENSIDGHEFDILVPKTAPSTKNIDIISMANTGILTPYVKKTAQSNECMMCEFVLHFLQDFLQEKHNRDEVKNAVDNICKLLPHTIGEECQDYVDAYGDQMIQFIILEMDPSVICPMLHMCPGVSVTPKQLSSATKSDICVTCEFVMEIVDEMLTKNVMKIKSSIKLVCSEFPSNVRGPCDKFVDKYGDAIIHYLEMEAKPEEICKLISLCAAAPKQYTGTNFATILSEQLVMPSLQQIEIPFVQKASCVLCEFIMRELDQYLIFPSTLKKIESAVDRVCLVLPSHLQTDCLSFLEKYSVPLIEFLISSMDPTTVCKAASLCYSALKTEMPVLAVSFSTYECDICQTVVDDAKRLAHFTAADLNAKTCSNMATNVEKRLCEDFVQRSASSLHTMITELHDSKSICMATKMCPNPRKRELLGQKKCTWGPSYWCISEWHASSCHATQHCEEHGWQSSDKPTSA